MSGDLLGTLRYMAPEQALARHGLVDHRADVYGLGATLCELLTLRPAVDGTERAEILRQIAFEEPNLPRQVIPTVPAELETIVLKAMEKEPADRYATARDLADDLRRFLDNRPIHARRASLPQRARKWAGRHQPLILVTLIFSLLTVATLAVATRQIARSRGEAIEAGRHADAHRQDAEARAELLSQRLYVADMGEAYRRWQRGDQGGMTAALERHVPVGGETDQRGFEWHLLRELAQRRFEAQRVLRGHTGIVYHAVFSPDGRTIASGGQRGELRLWDAATGECTALLAGHTKDVNWISFHPHGQSLATASDDGSVRLWDISQKRQIAGLTEGTGPVECVVFSPDGSHLAAAGADAVIRVWEVASRSMTAELEGHRVVSRSVDENLVGVEVLVFSTDGFLLASAGHDGTVIVWDWKTKNEHRRLATTHAALGVAFSADGAHIAAVDRGGEVSVWTVADGQLLWRRANTCRRRAASSLIHNTLTNSFPVGTIAPCASGPPTRIVVGTGSTPRKVESGPCSSPPTPGVSSQQAKTIPSRSGTPSAWPPRAGFGSTDGISVCRCACATPRTAAPWR